MQQVLILSGKGGAGKTSFVAAFCSLAGKCVLADCDVDAADLHLLVNGDKKNMAASPFFSGVLPVVATEKCNGCGQCEKVCNFSAITLDGPESLAEVNRFSCEGCGSCHDTCPKKAITLVDRQSGELLVTTTDYGPLVQARLAPGEGNSGKLVSLVRTRAQEIAAAEELKLVLIDGAPGISCPVIASLTGVNLVVMVVEPSVSGLHDLSRVVELIHHFNIKGCVALNKYDLEPEMTGQVVSYCAEKGIEIIGQVHFDPLFIDAMVAEKPLPTWSPRSQVTRELTGIWKRTKNILTEIEN